MSLRVGFATFSGAKVVSRSMGIPKVLDTTFFLAGLRNKALELTKRCVKRIYSYFKCMKFFYVYILECSDGTYYTGITSNLEKRIESHQSGKNHDSYTSIRRPVKLVFYCDFTEATKAIETEKQIKKWSKAKKEALILGEFGRLPNLAKKKFK